MYFFLRLCGYLCVVTFRSPFLQPAHKKKWKSTPSYKIIYVPFPVEILYNIIYNVIFSRKVLFAFYVCNKKWPQTHLSSRPPETVFFTSFFLVRFIIIFFFPSDLEKEKQYYLIHTWPLHNAPCLLFIYILVYVYTYRLR